MKLFADECIYQNTVDLLRKSGFEVITVQEAGLAGYSNGDVLTYAVSNGCVFLTRDKDFSDIRVYPPTSFMGIIVIKISPENQEAVHATLCEFLSGKTSDELNATLTIVGRQKYRTVR
jgi:predicted nuclease of predicted toxin-antitoxin system